MAELKEGLIGGAVNLYFIYKFLRMLTTPWENTDAFKLGIIDKNGGILRKKRTLKTLEEKEAYTMMDRLVWKLKRLMEKIPFGKTRLASYAAALWLIKEEKSFYNNDKDLQESFLSFLETDWKDKALILKENYEGDMDKKTFSNLRKEGIDIKKASMGDVIKDFQSSDAPQFKGKSDKKKKEMAVAAKLSKEEVEINEMMWEVGVVYHQEFKNGDRVYFRADSVQKNKRWKGMSVDEFGGKQKKAKNNTADEKQAGWEITPKNEIPKGLKEEFELEEHCGHCEFGLEEKAKYDLYHKTYSDAVQHAADVAKKQGYEVDQDSWDSEISFGQRKPSAGKTVSKKVKLTKGGKEQRKQLHIQVYGMDSGKYELNMYIESLEEVKSDYEDEIAAFKKKGGKVKKLKPGKKFKSLFKQKGPKKPPRKEEVEIDEKRKSLKNTKDVGMECQECGNKFRAKLSTLEYGRTKCPKCKSTDLDFQFGEEVEIDEKKVLKLRDLNVYAAPKKKDKKKGSTSPRQMAFGISRKGGFGVGKGYGSAKKAPIMMGEDELDEEVSEKDYDSLKRGDTITIEFKSSMSSGKSTFKVTAKNIVGKAKVGKVTLQNVKNPKSVKFFLYKRGNKVSLAQGDMAASVVKYTIEGVELDEATVLQINDVDQWTHEIYKGIKAGWKSVSKSTLGGDANVAIMIKVTVEPEKDWPHKILHNAKFGMIRIATDGTMEMFASGHKIKNMRKTKIKSARDVVNKINSWIKAVSEGIIEFSSFKDYLTEGRPRIEDPDAMRPGDDAKRILVKAQKKIYKPEEIVNIARKHKVKIDGEPVGGKGWGGDWEIALRGGVTLDYDYRNNETYIKGWKVDRKKIRAHINKYEMGGSTYEDLLGRGGLLNVRGFETAFELIGEEVELNEAKFAGWIAFYNKDKLEIKKSEADGLYDAKLLAIKHFKVPKSKQGLLAIEPAYEEAPANKTGVNVVGTGDDPTVWKKKKKRINAKVEYEDFSGTRVYVVSNERWHASRLGKNRYSRYEKYVGNDKLGETIRLYGRTNPKSPIILKNEENGAMLYLKYGGSKRTW